jgi:DNA primase
VKDQLGRSNRYSEVLYSYLDPGAEQHDEVQCTCPWCGGNSSLWFNDVKGVWHCFKCGEGGNALDLVEKMEGTYREPEIEVEQISAELRSIGRDTHDAPRVLSEAYLRQFRKPGSVHELWAARGFDAAVCDRWELGYDFLGDTLTLPYRAPFTGHVEGIIYRRTDAGDGPRYKFPAGFARRSSLYGSWLLAPGAMAEGRGPVGEVFVEEGPTDAVRVSQTGLDTVAQYGSSISAGQVRLLHRLDVRRLVLFYDYDRAGIRATEKGSRLAEEFEVEKVVWDRDKYCWHNKVCGCDAARRSKDVWLEHTANSQLCTRFRSCKCGRIHEPDPCSLELKEIENMSRKKVKV